MLNVSTPGKHRKGAKLHSFNNFLADFSEAIAAMRADGLLVDNLIANGNWHRCQVDKGKRNQDGSYKAINFNSWPVVFWSNWSWGTNGYWCARSMQFMSKKEQAEFKAELDRIADEDRKLREAAQAAAAKRTAYIWEQAKPANEEHGYLQRKQIKPGPCRLAKDGRLIMPLYDCKNGQLMSLQFIAAIAFP